MTFLEFAFAILIASSFNSISRFCLCLSACRFASEVYQRYSDIQGLIWHSRQIDNHQSFVLFEPRLSGITLTIDQEFPMLADQEVRVWANEASKVSASIDTPLFDSIKTLPSMQSGSLLDYLKI